jgi:hypothetical protein
MVVDGDARPVEKIVFRGDFFFRVSPHCLKMRPEHAPRARLKDI